MPNRLINETSPYLLQHAHNPVDWYPWGKEALEKAKQENKVILVSIGYSACHWCHVMERESFENEDTARMMNDYFVNIKIDREERPDLDQVYMDAVQMLSGSGGWPLNCFLTPDAKPFYGGTYFPPVRAYNRSSWREVISAINQAWVEKSAELIEQANSLTDHLQQAGLFGVPDSPGTGISSADCETIAGNIMKSADTAWGGFGRAPKFPQTFVISFLLKQAWFDAGQLPVKTPGDKLLESPLVKQALLSLDKMMMGGIYDHLGGGFARYSTDAQWLVPHFEKMLYDNALLVSVLCDAYRVTGKPEYLAVINQTLAFIRRDWQDKDGGFFSAFDADSEGVEGKYYTWQKAEIERIIGNPEASELFCAYYGVSGEGNWEHSNILWVQQPIEIFCRARALDLQDTKTLLEKASLRLLMARNDRPAPLLDDKKLMSWNALMISACCQAWQVTGNETCLEMAEKAAAFIEEKLATSDGRYHHNYKAGVAANPAFLDDLAFYIEALCHLQECTGEKSYLQKASAVTQSVADLFSEKNGDMYYFTPVDQKDIIFQKKELYDGATPSGNSVMARNLYYLGVMLDKPGWKERAVRMILSLKKLTTSYPSSFAYWAQVMQWVCYGAKELAVVGEKHADFSAEILSLFWPNKILQQGATNDESLPLLTGRITPAGKTSIFLCVEYACHQPVYNVDELLAAEMID